tara:strand:+ start:563 stop:1747 length:1185 start_codon:yes stop_codon:yes gene_type:complete
MPKYQNLEKNIYKKKLLDIAKVYNVIDIKKKLLISKLTIKQIETLLKKNNVSLPKNDSKNNLNPIVWENILKVSLIAVVVVGFFGALPILYKQNLSTESAKQLKIQSMMTKKSDNLKENEIINEFNLSEDVGKKENTVRLEASTLNEIFKEANYDLEIIRKTKKVKPIYISILPKEINQIENTKEKKNIFIKIVLPLILKENEKIILNRKKLFNILGKSRNSKNEKKWLKQKFKEYLIKNSDIAELKIRMDIIPVSLAIAQAAKETGWGTSRFAIEGNALFGQWTYSDNGIEPLDSTDGNHKVMKFNVLQASVKAYKKNLNTHKGYKKFRRARANLRERGKEIDSLKLTKFLNKYAQTGEEYTLVLEKIIKQNSLMDFDQAKLLPSKSVISNNI